MGGRSDKGGNHAHGVWTPELVEKLKQLWLAGHSCSQIAAQLGHCISRCAVIGKVSRLGLPPRVTTMRARRTYTAPPKPKTVVPQPELTGAQPFLGEPGAFTEKGTCRFINGDTAGKDWIMCGQPGFPWCPHHRAICFDKAKTVLAVRKAKKSERDFDFRRAG